MAKAQVSTDRVISALTLAQISVDVRELLGMINQPAAVKLLRRIEAYATALQTDMDLPPVAGVALDAIANEVVRHRVATMTQADVIAALTSFVAVQYQEKAE